MRRMCLYTILVTLAWGSVALAELPTVDELTKKMVEASRTRKTYSADTRVIVPPGGGLSINATGKMVGKNVERDGVIIRKVYAEVTSKIRLGTREVTVESKRVTVGDITWLESRNSRTGAVRVVKQRCTDLSSQGMEPGQDEDKEMQAFKEMYDLKVVGEEEMDGVRVYVIDGRFKDSYLDDHPAAAAAKKARARVRIYVGCEDMFTRKVKIYDENGRESIVREFTNVRFDEPVDDKLFEYTPPKDAKIEDKTKDKKKKVEKKADEKAVAPE